MSIGAEQHVVDVVGVPPVPRDLAGPDPLRIADARGGCQAIDDVGGEQVGVFPGDGEHAPRERAIPRGARDPGLPLRDALGAVTCHLGRRWIVREETGKGIVTETLDVHAWIVEQVRFRDRHERAFIRGDQ
jgi:hypothetical protein